MPTNRSLVVVAKRQPNLGRNRTSHHARDMAVLKPSLNREIGKHQNPAAMLFLVRHLLENRTRLRREILLSVEQVQATASFREETSQLVDPKNLIRGHAGQRLRGEEANVLGSRRSLPSSRAPKYLVADTLVGANQSFLLKLAQRAAQRVAANLQLIHERSLGR